VLFLEDVTWLVVCAGFLKGEDAKNAEPRALGLDPTDGGRVNPSHFGKSFEGPAARKPFNTNCL
jgi:hypothetical protein